MIKYYQSAIQVVDGKTSPVANTTIAGRAEIAYLGDQAGIMAEVNQAQHDEILATGGVEKTRAEIAFIYPFPATWPPFPWGG